MSRREGLISRAFGALGFTEELGFGNSLFHKNGVYKPDLKKLQIGAVALSKINVNVARWNFLNERTDPYDSSTTIFVDGADFRDVLSGVCSFIPENYVGFVVRNNALAGQVIKFTLSADVPHSLHLGTNDPSKINSLTYSDKLIFDPSEPYIVHESIEPTVLMPGCDFAYPTQEVVSRATNSVNGVAHVSSSNLCGIDQFGRIIDFLV